jgi:MFS family permease
MALPVGLAVVAPFAGALRRHVGVRVSIPVSFLVMAGGLAFAARSSGLGGIAGGLGVAGVGLGIANTMNNASIMDGIAATDRGSASALVNMVRAFGTAVGLALVTTLIASFGGVHEVSAPRGALTVLVAIPLVSAALCAVLLPSRVRPAPVRSEPSD